MHFGHMRLLQSMQKYSSCLSCFLHTKDNCWMDGRSELLVLRTSRALFFSSSETISTKRFRLQLLLSSSTFPVPRTVTWRQFGHSKSKGECSSLLLCLTTVICLRQPQQKECAQFKTLGSDKKSKQMPQINSSCIFAWKVLCLDFSKDIVWYNSRSLLANATAIQLATTLTK